LIDPASTGVGFPFGLGFGFSFDPTGPTFPSLPTVNDGLLTTVVFPAWNSLYS